MQGKDVPIRVMICDDDEVDLRRIADLVCTVIPKTDVMTFTSSRELLSEVKDYDIVLLDIEMPGENGLSVARKLRRKWRGIVVIFVTAIKDYVFDAFKVDAFRYLVKPINRDDLTEVLFSATERRDENIRGSLYEPRAGLPVDNGGNLLVISKGLHIAVPFSEIVYAEIFNRIIILHMANGDDIEYYGRMSDLEKLVGSEFYRCHRSYLLHFKYIKKYDAKTIILKTGTVDIAKNKYSEFVKRYMEYLKK